MNRELSQLETYLVHEFIEDYVDGIMSRRDMMCRVLRITGGVAATATVLTQLGVKSASAQEGTPAPPPTPTGPRSTVSVAEDDPRVTASDVTFPGLDGAEIIAWALGTRHETPTIPDRDPARLAAGFELLTGTRFPPPE